VLRTLASFEAPVLRIEADNGRFDGPAMLAAAANSPFFGGGMMIAPDADPTDGALDLVVIDRVSRMRALRVFPRVYRGTHVDHPAVRTLRTRSVTIHSDRPLTLFADGEQLAALREGGSRIDVVPRALAIVH
jgi:diacylglycerol kinase (ATP)